VTTGHDGFFFEATDQDWALTDTMIGYWTNFARTGDPNGPGLPLWPAYDPSTDTWLVLDHEIRTRSGVRQERLDALEPTLIRKTESLR
jgi:para-nitrobenzyl esterase